MSAPLDAAGLGALPDYSTPLFHKADFPPSLSPRIFQGTFQGGQDVRKALGGICFVILSYFSATTGGLPTSVSLMAGSLGAWFQIL